MYHSSLHITFYSVEIWSGSFLFIDSLNVWWSSKARFMLWFSVAYWWSNTQRGKLCQLLCHSSELRKRAGYDRFICTGGDKNGRKSGVLTSYLTYMILQIFRLHLCLINKCRRESPRSTKHFGFREVSPSLWTKPHTHSWFVYTYWFYGDFKCTYQNSSSDLDETYSGVGLPRVMGT